MIPELFSLGPIPVHSFGLMIACAVLASSYLLAKSFRVAGYNPGLAETFVFTAGFSGLVGARGWYIVKNYEDFTFAMLLSTSGFVFYGGFFFAFLAMYILSVRSRIPFSGFLDAAGPAMVLGYAIGRLGCQLSGDGDYGVYTTSILGMSYLTGVVPTPKGVLAYPTPLYETATCFLILWVLLSVERRPSWQVPLRRFGLCILLMGLERFAVEFIRLNPKVWWGYSEAQVISLVLCAVGVFLCSRQPRALPAGEL